MFIELTDPNIEDIESYALPNCYDHDVLIVHWDTRGNPVHWQHGHMSPCMPVREHLFACAECNSQYIGMYRACLFASGWVRAHAIGIFPMSRPNLLAHLGQDGGCRR